MTAIVARTFAYHRPYDDALMLLPMIALARIVVSGTASPVAAGLLTAVWLGAIAPAHYVLYFAPFPVPELFQLYQAVAWLTTLSYLAGRCEMQAVSLVRDPVAVQGA